MSYQRTAPLAACAAALIVGSIAFAQQNDHSVASRATTFESEELPVATPRSIPEDYYPAQAMRLEQSGRVLLAYSVAGDGSAQNLSVVESAGKILDEAATRLLKATRHVVPEEWNELGGSSKRYRFCIIYRLEEGSERATPDSVVGCTVITATHLRRFSK